MRSKRMLGCAQIQEGFAQDLEGFAQDQETQSYLL